MTSKELRESRLPVKKALEDLKKIIDTEKRAFNQEEEEKWSKLNDEWDTISKRIKVAETLEGMDSETVEKELRSQNIDTREIRKVDRSVSEETRSLAITGWMAARAGQKPSEDQRDAVRKLGFDLAARSIDIDLFDTRTLRRIRETRALNTVTGSAGGVTVPEGFIYQLEKKLQAVDSIRAISHVVRTAQGNPLVYSGYDDTDNEGEESGQNQEVGEADPTWVSITLNAYKTNSKMVKVSAEMILDSAFDIEAELSNMFGLRIGKRQQSKFTTGSGTNEPQGYLVGGTLGVTTASPTAITFNEVMDLLYAVQRPYRDNATFVCHDNIAKTLRKIVDGQGRYIWELDVKSSTPDVMLGRPVKLNSSAPSAVTATQKTLACGDFESGYVVRDARSIRVRHLVERYAETDSEGFVAFQHSDGRVLQPTAIQYMQQHA